MVFKAIKTKQKSNVIYSYTAGKEGSQESTLPFGSGENFWFNDNKTTEIRRSRIC